MISKPGTLISDLPPFPSDVPCAPIARIHLEKILNDDPAATSAVYEACRTHGFFYLDLQSTSLGDTLIKESENLLEVSASAFDHPTEEKAQHAIVKGGRTLFGYKPAGTVKKTGPNQRPDITEMFNISKDHMHGFTKSRSYPSDIWKSQDLIKSFQKNAHTIGMLILSTLASKLGVSPDEFATRNDFTRPAGDHVRLTYMPGQVLSDETMGLVSHTDFGSITILFNWLGGLQIQSHEPETRSEWLYVKPLAGCAIINLGDAIVTFTNGMLKSAKHRVVAAPGEQSTVDRYSLVYFVRPNDDVLMEPLEKFKNVNQKLTVAGKFEPEGNEVLTVGDWMMQRTRQLGVS
jgi:isopenicillin N synthase-like dioxygenase